jgi:hypothetical protein
MSDLTQLSTTTSVDGGDLIYAVKDPAGTPLDRAISADNLAASTPFSDLYESKQIISLAYSEASPGQQTIAANTTLTLYTWNYTATQRGMVEFFASSTLYGASGTQSAAGQFYLRDTLTPQTLGTFRWHTNAIERQLQVFCWGKLFMPTAGDYEVQLLCSSDSGSGQSMQNRDSRFCVTRTDF